MAVAWFAIGGCIVLVIGLVARNMGVKHRMPVRVRRIVRDALPCWVKMRERGGGETDEKSQRRDASQIPPDHDSPIMTRGSDLVKECGSGASRVPAMEYETAL